MCFLIAFPSPKEGLRRQQLPSMMMLNFLPTFHHLYTTLLVLFFLASGAPTIESFQQHYGVHHVNKVPHRQGLWGSNLLNHLHHHHQPMLRAQRKDSEGAFGGLRILEWTNQIVPQSLLVKGARTSWNLLWKVSWWH